MVARLQRARRRTARRLEINCGRLSASRIWLWWRVGRPRDAKGQIVATEQCAKSPLVQVQTACIHRWYNNNNRDKQYSTTHTPEDDTVGYTQPPAHTHTPLGTRGSRGRLGGVGDELRLDVPRPARARRDLGPGHEPAPGAYAQVRVVAVSIGRLSKGSRGPGRGPEKEVRTDVLHEAIEVEFGRAQGRKAEVSSELPRLLLCGQKRDGEGVGTRQRHSAAGAKRRAEERDAPV